MRLANGNMLDQSTRGEVDAFQSLPFHLLTGRCIDSSHDKNKFHTITLNAAIFRYCPMRVGEAGEKVGHHGMNLRTAFVFAEEFGMVGGIAGKQGLNNREIVIVG